MDQLGSSHFGVIAHDSCSAAALNRVFHTISTDFTSLLAPPYTAYNWAALVGQPFAREGRSTASGNIMPVLTSALRKPCLSPLMEAVFRVIDTSEVQLAPAPEDISADVDAILEGFHLQRIRRFYGQSHWTDETVEAEFSDKAEPGLKLENVAAHSWHVADAAHLLAGHFLELDVSKVVLLAVLHDKLEIYTGDYDPVGPDGRGTGTHAFDEGARKGKEQAEREAAEHYLAKLRPAVRDWQRMLLEELIESTSPEARFVKAVDKLQALAFVVEKKAGTLSDEHLFFTVVYSRKALVHYPRIRFHYAELLNRLLDSIAACRGIERSELDKQVFGQLELNL